MPGKSRILRSKQSKSGRLRTTLALLLLVAGTTAGPAAAQTQPIEERRPLRPDADVEIGAVVHAITIERWDRDEIEITGEYDPRWEEIEIRGDDRSLRFEVRANREGRHTRSTGARTLTVRVPESVRLRAASVSGSILARGLTGTVTLNSVSGDVRMEGNPASVRLNSVSGRVGFRGSAREVEAESVSGDVRVESSGPLDAGSISAVSGDVHFSGSLRPGGQLDAESHSGDVELMLSDEVDARVSLSTFSGSVSSGLSGAGDEVRERGRYVPTESLTFTSGSGAGRVEARSFSGDVRLRGGRD